MSADAPRQHPEETLRHANRALLAVNVAVGAFVASLLAVVVAVVALVD